MRKQVLLVGITLVLLAASLSGCTDSSVDDKSKFVGTWRYEEINATYRFFANGTYTLVGDPTVNEKWYLQDGKIVLTNPWGEDVAYYSFSDDYNTLTLTDVDDPDFKLVLTKLTNQ